MSGAGSAKGQPLVALLAVLAGWIGGRVATWEAPRLTAEAVAAQAEQSAMDLSTVGFVVDGRAGPQSLPGALSPAYPSTYLPTSISGYLTGYPRGLAVPDASGGLHGSAPAAPVPPPAPIIIRPLVVWNPAGSGWGPSAQMFMPPAARPIAAGGVTSESVPRFLAPEAATTRPEAPARAVVPAMVPPPARSKRWSMDAWALLRRGGESALSSGALPATYGASQSGAVLRYRIDLSNIHRPTLYARTTSALSGFRENSAALGISARPFPAVPVVAAVEGRLTEQAWGRRFQSAAFAYTELPPIALPNRLQAEVYFQGGYVGGKFSTPFADGQVKIDRQVLRLGRVSARLGGGLWGGAQKGAARLDTGPSASVALPLGKGVFGRAALDWRFRVAGDAEPGSGPAVTLSAGF